MGTLTSTRPGRDPTSRTGLDTAVEIVSGASQIGLTLLGAPLLRHRFNRWGATAAERARPMRGDHLVPEPQTTYTRAVTIDAPPEEVWAWLVQIGHGRGGLYSYDALENLVGCDIHSARSILPEHQQLSVGDVVRMGPEGYPCFRVVHCASPNTLVLVGAHPTTAELPPLPAPADRSETVATWQWALRGTPVGGTRLVARQRLTYPPGQSVLWHLVEPVAFVMERRMLLTLKHLAETADA